MRTMKPALRLLMVLLCTVSVFAQEPADQATIARIRAEGLERSQVLETFHHLVTTIGPRLTNSPAQRRSVEWTQERLKAMGLVNVHAEPFAFGRGWTLERFSVEMIEPRYQPLIGYPKAGPPRPTDASSPRRPT